MHFKAEFHFVSLHERLTTFKQINLSEWIAVLALCCLSARLLPMSSPIMLLLTQPEAVHTDVASIDTGHLSLNPIYFHLWRPKELGGKYMY